MRGNHLAARSYLDRPFRDLIQDAGHAARQAEHVDKTNFHVRATYGRMAVLVSAASLECASNACLESVDLGGKFRDEVDRLSFLAKFDLYLRLARNGHRLDLGSRPVQLVRDIKHLRDDLTHPKTSRLDLVMDTPESGHLESPTLPTLGVPRSSRLWEAVQVASIVEATLGFFNHYFIQLCALESDAVCHLLLDEIEVPGQGGRSVAPVTWGDTWLRDDQSGLRFDLTFLGAGIR